MHKVTFYPVGNGDTTQIVLENGKRILLDYHHIKKAEEPDSPEIDLKAHLSKELADAKRTSFDVVVLTHADKDHIGGCRDFFYFQHSKDYQGAGRIHIDELWVPASVLTEAATSDEIKADSEFIALRDEARYRLKNGKGIRVFSRPDLLKKWLEKHDIPFESRRHLFVDAGKLAEGFTLESDGIEFFCHSPFVKHVDSGDELRNESSLIFNIRFRVGGSTFDYLAVGDTKWETIEDIVGITEYHKRFDRLEWDLFNIPHHCSYRALSDEKGATITIPKPGVEKWLRAGRPNSYIVSSSKPIPDSADAREQDQPPHIQARKCYEKYLKEVGGAKFLVTMEEPRESKPEPIVFEIEASGISRKESGKRSAAAILTGTRAPRAG